MVWTVSRISLTGRHVPSITFPGWCDAWQLCRSVLPDFMAPSLSPLSLSLKKLNWFMFVKLSKTHEASNASSCLMECIMAWLHEHETSSSLDLLKKKIGFIDIYGSVTDEPMDWQTDGQSFRDKKIHLVILVWLVDLWHLLPHKYRFPLILMKA